MNFENGFLPKTDPLTHFPTGSPFEILDTVGHDLPSLLQDKEFRVYAKNLNVPSFDLQVDETTLPLLRLYYVRLGFLASAYVNQLGQETATSLPANIAVPLVKCCELLGRPPVLSYDGYALYNWKRFDSTKPIVLGNIDTIQNFVHMYDEHWFILIHVEIEAYTQKMFAGLNDLKKGEWNKENVNVFLHTLLDVVTKQVEVLKRIPEKMDPELYFKTFRPYIRFFENVVYEGVNNKPMNYRGETGAQSSIMPFLDSFLKIPHEKSILTEHLKDMRQYMPQEHRQFLEEVTGMPDVKPLAEPEVFNALLEKIAEFRETHLNWAIEYIQKHVADPRGTGGTPYMKWLKKLIDETRDFQF